MLKYINSKKGQTGLPLFFIPLVMLISFGHYKYDSGKWGNGGTDTLEARQQKIIDGGGHINNADRWYEDIRP